MELTDPFIVENGGAIFIPKGYFPEVFLRCGKACFRTCGDYDCLKLGRPYIGLIRTLVEIQTEAGISLIGFHRMDEDKIMRQTGLDRMQARLAARREYDEPFLIRGNVSQAQTKKTESLAAQRSCMIVQGGRFYHLTGKSDNGRVVRTLMRLYRAARKIQIFLGFGDSENDLSLLRSVNVPILMAKPGGSFDPEVLKRILQVRRTPEGPAG
jgi:mannosyl-3-phosphoglycerate phosphatase